ncbi:MAG: hypothetical protein J6F32_09180, partial [Pseudomonas sp.]|nr:hypothetical protein [Pseudomonas sp.]
MLDFLAAPLPVALPRTCQQRGSAEPLRQVFLVQNSGWMEPFYSDPSSPFKSMVTQLVGTAAGSAEVVIGGFNQADSQHPSPEWIYRGP